MNFKPRSKEQFIAEFKAPGFEHLSEKEKEDIYYRMCYDAFMGVVAINSLGGTMDHQPFNEGTFRLLAPKEAQRCLSENLNCNPDDINPEKALNYYIDQYAKANENH